MFNQKTNSFCKKLKIRMPIIQAPMAGGIVSPALIKEVTSSGGLGSLPLGYLSIEEARAMIRETAALNAAPFAVNMFIPSPANLPSLNQFNKMFMYLNDLRMKLGLSLCTQLPPWLEPDIDELIAMIIAEGVSIISLTFGLLSKKNMDRLLQNNIFVMGTATTVHEGLALEASGCHAVIAQGYEAGGHRGGGFLAEHPEGFIGTMALIPQMVDALTIPVIAAGGIMDGRGIAAALSLGASAVQMGTAFLVCDESKASAMHQQMVLESPAESTCCTAVYTGKTVRCFKNEFVTVAEQKFTEDEIAPYPLQHQFTKDIRSYASKTGRADYAGLWSGQGTQLSRALSVANLMAALEKETYSAIAPFGALF